MDRMFIKSACRGSQFYSMYIVGGIPTVYYGDTTTGGIATKTFATRRAMRQWVNYMVHSK